MASINAGTAIGGPAIPCAGVHRKCTSGGPRCKCKGNERKPGINGGLQHVQGAPAKHSPLAHRAPAAPPDAQSITPAIPIQRYAEAENLDLERQMDRNRQFARVGTSSLPGVVGRKLALRLRPTNSGSPPTVEDGGRSDGGWSPATEQTSMGRGHHPLEWRHRWMELPHRWATGRARIPLVGGQKVTAKCSAEGARAGAGRKRGGGHGGGSWWQPQRALWLIVLVAFRINVAEGVGQGVWMTSVAVSWSLSSLLMRQSYSNGYNSAFQTATQDCRARTQQLTTSVGTTVETEPPKREDANQTVQETTQRLEEWTQWLGMATCQEVTPSTLLALAIAVALLEATIILVLTCQVARTSEWFRRADRTSPSRCAKRSPLSTPCTPSKHRPDITSIARQLDLKTGTGPTRVVPCMPGSHPCGQEVDEQPSQSQAWGNWNPEWKSMATRDELDSKLIADYVMQGGTLQNLTEKTNVPTKFYVAALETAIKAATRKSEPAPKSDPWWNGYVGRKRG